MWIVYFWVKISYIHRKNSTFELMEKRRDNKRKKENGRGVLLKIK